MRNLLHSMSSIRLRLLYDRNIFMVLMKRSSNVVVEVFSEFVMWMTTMMMTFG